MPNTDKGEIKERIDTNKDYIINIDEIKDFVFDNKNGTNNLNELGNYLNSLPYFSNDMLKGVLMRYFTSNEWGEQEGRIRNKVESNQPLDQKELSLLYLQMVDLYSRTKQEIKGSYNPNEPLSGELLTFIQRQYKENKSYKPQTIENFSQRIQSSQGKDKNGLYTKPVPSNIEIPQIPELNESNKNYIYNYCYDLMKWAEKNFPNDIANIHYNAGAEHYDQKKKDIPEYARYDVLLFAFEKYCEIINNNHEKIITGAGYQNDEEFQQQTELLAKLQEEIQSQYPNLDEALNVLQKFGEEVENNKKRYFRNDQELDKAQHDAEEFNNFLETKTKEYGIEEIKASMEKDPETSEEAAAFFKGINKILEYQKELTQKSESYGGSIEKYQQYTKGNLEISKRYPNINEYAETQKQYSEFIKGWQNKIDFNKYEEYNKQRKESGIDKDFNNMSVLSKTIMNPEDEDFPILGVKNAIAEKQKKIDTWRDNLQKKNSGAYRLLNSLVSLRNGTVYSLASAGSSLAYIIASGLGKDTAKLNKAKNFYDNLFYGRQSSEQKDPIYDTATHTINLNRHNGVATVSSSIGQMLVLIYGGGLIGESLKGIGVASNIAGNLGLFSMSFITQVGESFVEAKNKNLDGGAAFAYSVLSSTVQSALELVSPNKVLLGKGNNIIKELIKNLVKDGSKNSFMMLGKAFLKNVGIEIAEENFQEALQLAAGNLINLYADGKRGTDFGADWSWKNFAQTAIITTLTTGITTGTSYMLQMGNISENDRAILFNEVLNDKGTYDEVMSMIDKAIAGKITIPNVDIPSLQQLKDNFTNKKYSNDTHSDQFNETNVVSDDEIYVEVVPDNEIYVEDTQEGKQKEIRRVANILKDFVNFDVDMYVEGYGDIPLFGKSEQYIRNVASFVKVNFYENQNTNDRSDFFHDIRTIDFILSTSKLTTDDILSTLQNEKINMKDIQYAVANNNNISNVNQLIQEIQKYNILLHIESEEDLQKYVEGKKTGSNITGDIDQFIIDKNLLDSAESAKNWYYGNFDRETQKFTMARDLEGSEYDIQLIKNIINQQNIKPRALENNSIYDALIQLHNENRAHGLFCMYSRYLLGEDITDLAGKYSEGSGGGFSKDLALYWHTEISGDYVRYRSKYRIIGEFDPGEIIRSGELNSENPNLDEYERITLGEVSNNNVTQIIDLETGKTIYDRNSGYVDPLFEGNSETTETVSRNNSGGIVSHPETEITDSQQYFDGKSHKFKVVTESQALSNSESMDHILNDINKQNKSEKLQELRNQIIEQYKQATGKEIELSDQQLLSIIDAHEQDGIIGELTIPQLKQKVEALDKTITDPKIRRFLLEAGFCGRHFRNIFHSNEHPQQTPRQQFKHGPLDQMRMKQFNQYPKTDRAMLFLRYGLYPSNIMYIGDNILYVTDQIIDNTGRSTIIGYSWSNQNNTFDVRLFYKSQSEGCRRSCPGLAAKGVYSKGQFLVQDAAYETTTKVHPTIGNYFDNLKVQGNGSPIIDILESVNGGEILANEMKASIHVQEILFPTMRVSSPNAAKFYGGKQSSEVIKAYNDLIPQGLDYKHMSNNPNKAYSYTHQYLGQIEVEVCTMKIYDRTIDIHFAHAKSSPDKVRIDNVISSKAQVNNFCVYDYQINAGPFAAKPIDYRSQVPLDYNSHTPIPGTNYIDIRDLYQGNPVVKRYKKKILKKTLKKTIK